jgi:uncharacterized protein YqeY
MLIEKIKADALVARKAKMTSVSSLLTTLIGEAEMVGKNAGNRAVTDDEVVAIIKKFIKNINDTITALGDQDPRTLVCLGEKSTLEEYLPKQMDEYVLTVAVRMIINELGAGANMGQVMAALKSKHSGQYDGKMASTVVKACL